MRWIWKVAAFKTFGWTPGGEAIYHFIQRNITRSMAVSASGNVLPKIHVGMKYLDFFERVLRIKDFRAITHVDIGTGWMPTIPLLFYSVGFERQVLCDIRYHLQPKIVSDVISTFRQVVSRDINLETRCRHLPPLMDPGDKVESYLARIGIRYIAPYSYEDLLDEKGFKIVTCTDVLLHLNKEQLRSLFKAVASALKKDGGIFIAPIPLYDVYSIFDRSLSPYNKWRYSDFVWDKLVNSELMSFNRLTASDYGQLLEEGGFEIMEFRTAEPTISDLQKLRSTKVHKQFRHIPERELAAKELFFVAKPRGASLSARPNPRIPSSGLKVAERL